MAVSKSNLYTRSKSTSFKSINEAQVCVGKSCFLTPKRPAFSTEEIKDNNEKAEKLKEEDDQDIYVPRFSIPPIPTLFVCHDVDKDVEYEKIESVNEAQVCVDDSFLSRSESHDSESTIIGSMNIESLIASGKKCDADKDSITNELKKSECYTVAKGLTMKESMERSNVISVMGSSFQSSSPHMKNFGRSASSRQKYKIHGKRTALDKTFDTIRVRLKQPLTQDTLENYFVNTRKSGGGDIDSFTIIKGTDMEVEEVLITFSESKDAMNCLQQQHIIDKQTLNVQKYDPNDPSLWEIDKVLVTGLNPVTTQDTLMNFLEPAAGVDLIELMRGVQKDAAIVVFAEKPDFAKMSKKCKDKKVEGNTLSVHLVEKCHTIYVKGIDTSISNDLVEFFFCNKKKSGGGDVEKVDYHPEDGYCIVYFENPSDAKNAAAKGKFTVIGKEIQAQMYFPCLGLPEQSINWEEMPCVSYKINKYLIKFVKNRPAECSQIEEALQKKFVNVEWPESKSDLFVNLKCTVTKDMENAKDILKSWKEEAEAEMDRQMKKLVYQTQSILPEAWPLFLAQMKTVNIDDPDKVTVNLERKIHAPGKEREVVKKAEKEASCIILNEKGLQHFREVREVEFFKGHKRTSHFLPIKFAEYKLQYSDKKFIVMKGDVTKLKVDVIVNAANGDLDHCRGLALAISQAGGKSIQEESKTYIVSYGTVPVGEAVSALPGELPCKMLIHAVGPKWRGGSLGEEHLLKRAIFKCLDLTDKYMYSSIAIPAISAGFFGYPAAKSVDAILDAIKSYIKSLSSSIKEIYFCDLDYTIVKEFVKCLKKNFGLEVREFIGDEHVQQSPVQDENSDSEEEKPRRNRHRDDNLNCEIKVISGTLAKMRVDVIVNSTDKSLNLTLGATSKSLLRAGGESLQKECRMKYKSGVQPGEVAVTKGGNLHCRQVYHGAIKKWDHYKGDALSKFTEFVNNCLQMADKNSMSSIAFPAVGTGRQGYPRDLAAKTMFKCCRDFLHQKSSTTLKEIIFVVYHEDKETFQTFQSILRLEDVSRGTETSSSSYPQRRNTGRFTTRKDYIY